MSAPKGNQYWKLRRHNASKERKFTSPMALQKAAIEYFEWIEANPLIENDDFQYQGEVVQNTKPKMRAMTIAGLCLHMGIMQQTWRRWRNDKEDDYKAVMSWIEDVIFEQKFTGAAAGLLKENLIARELGLQDQQKRIHAGEVDHNLKPDDATKAYLEMMGKK